MGSSYTSRGGYVDDYDKRYETSRADHRSKSRRYTRSKSPGGQRNSRSPDTADDNRRRSRSRGESRGHRRRTRSRSRSRGHSRSRDYERGGSRSYRRTRSRSREDSRGRRTKRRRTRSKSPAAAGSSVKNELKTEADNYYNNYDDDWGEDDVDLGYGVTSRDLVGLSREEKIAVRDKYCDLCQVTLGDPASMVGHVRGMKHIQAKKDRGLPVPGLVDTTDEPVDTKFWIKQENKAPNSLSRDEEKEYRELKSQVNNLQRQVKDMNAKNIECRKKHKTTKELQDKKNELDREIAYYKRRCKELDDQMEQMSNAIPKREIKDEKIKAELKPKKEEYVEKENDNFEVIDVE